MREELGDLITRFELQLGAMELTKQECGQVQVRLVRIADRLSKHEQRKQRQKRRESRQGA